MHRYRHLALKTDDGGPHGVLPLAVGLFLGPETLGHPRFSISWSKKLHFPTLFGRYWSTPSRIALFGLLLVEIGRRPQKIAIFGLFLGQYAVIREVVLTNIHRQTREKTE